MVTKSGINVKTEEEDNGRILSNYGKNSEKEIIYTPGQFRSGVF